MARPFDERMPSHTGSSMSSQTNLNSYNAGLNSRDEPYYTSSTQYNDDDGQLWVQRKKAPRPIQGSRLAKIRSSPSDGALAAARSTASHGRLHKRGNSISGADSPASQISDSNITANYNLQGVSSPPNALTDPYSLNSSKSTSRSKVKIKPLLRKLSAHDSNTVDLSRSTAEHEGLGIYTSSEYSGPRPSVDYPPSGPSYHQRTTSTNSDRSTTTLGNQRYGANYVHPMRQTPRPYTPPLANSYKNSLDSEVPAPGSAIASSEGSQLDSSLRKPSPTPIPYAPLPSSRRIPPPLHVRTHSSSRLTSSSQTNLPGTPSSLRLQSDTIISTADAMSPTARSSLESAFRKRSRGNTANDPAAQAATVQALRQQFNEKEAAKDLRYQQAEARAQEKEARRKERRDESQRRKSEGKERNRARSNAASEKSSMNFGAQQYPFTTEPITEEIPRSQQQYRRRGGTASSAGKSVQSQWMLFWFKFKTMWLKLKRKMGSS